ncbi:hypothetical protein AALF15_10195 [Corynebacteriaceae bacterium 7-707]
MRRRILLPALLVSVAAAALTVPPVGSAAEPARAPHPVGAVAAAEALAADPAGGSSGTVTFPAELVAELGYRPGTRDGHPVNPDGDCSSPVPLPASFEPACMTHDLGYDLLRVADRTGETIPPRLRRGLDRRMAERMRESCSDDACRVMARAAHAAVAVNTLRQHDGAPVEEWFPW